LEPPGLAFFFATLEAVESIGSVSCPFYSVRYPNSHVCFFSFSFSVSSMNPPSFPDFPLALFRHVRFFLMEFASFSHGDLRRTGYPLSRNRLGGISLPPLPPKIPIRPLPSKSSFDLSLPLPSENPSLRVFFFLQLPLFICGLYTSPSSFGCQPTKFSLLRRIFSFERQDSQPSFPFFVLAEAPCFQTGLPFPVLHILLKWLSGPGKRLIMFFSFFPPQIFSPRIDLLSYFNSLVSPPSFL